MTTAHSPIDPGRIDANWRAITIELDAPVPSRTERLLRRLGLPASTTRVMVATPSLRRAWYLAVAVVVLIGLAGADSASPRSSLFVFLLIAPLLPAFGVSLAYGVEADPAHEVGLATPQRGLSLLLTRASAVLGFSVLVLAITSLLAADAFSPMAAAWLLPSLALTSSTIATMSFLPPRRSLAAVISLWGLVMLVARAVTADPLAPFGPAAQLLMAMVTLAGGAIMFGRRERFDRLGALS